MHSQEVFFMQTQYLIPPEVPQVPPYEAKPMAQGLAGDLALFLFPVLVTLDRLLDKRLPRDTHVGATPPRMKTTVFRRGAQRDGEGKKQATKRGTGLQTIPGYRISRRT